MRGVLFDRVQGKRDDVHEQGGVGHGMSGVMRELDDAVQYFFEFIAMLPTWVVFVGSFLVAFVLSFIRAADHFRYHGISNAYLFAILFSTIISVVVTVLFICLRTLGKRVLRRAGEGGDALPTTSSVLQRPKNFNPSPLGRNRFESPVRARNPSPNSGGPF
mmetsp:Transcript_34272/g.96573  ORF Transcript_34272/g.96573 Transcript_34272/m.96573 type:complete len:161 (+) Transcript_34272:267-749(+)